MALPSLYTQVSLNDYVGNQSLYGNLSFKFNLPSNQLSPLKFNYVLPNSTIPLSFELYDAWGFLICSKTFTPVSGQTIGTSDIFSGLNLKAGDYYLVSNTSYSGTVYPNILFSASASNLKTISASYSYVSAPLPPTQESYNALLAEKATALADLTTVTAARDAETIRANDWQSMYSDIETLLDTRVSERDAALADLTTVTAARDTALADLAFTDNLLRQKDVSLSSALGELFVLRQQVGNSETDSTSQTAAKTSLDSAKTAFNSILTPAEILAISADKKQTVADLANVTFEGANNLKLTADSRDNFIVGNDGNNVITGGDGSDTINGGSGDDVISGGNGNDTIVSLAGRNKLNGDAGDDLIIGSVQEDNIDGGIGNDTIFGGGGHDVIKGGLGNDSLIGSTLNDSIDGGDGADFINGGDGVNKLVGGKGNDTINAQAGNDSIDAGDGADTIQAGDGNNLISGGKDADTIQSGTGKDSISGGAGSDSIESGAGDDSIDGGADDDYIDSADGNDVVAGGAGNDTISAGAGNDKLDGGAGIDILIAGVGADTLIGGADADTFVLGLDLTSVKTVTDMKSTVDKLVFNDAYQSALPIQDVQLVKSVTSVFVFTTEIPSFGYNSKTGALFYDADGSGTGEQVQIALIANKAPLLSTDILV